MKSQEVQSQVGSSNLGEKSRWCVGRALPWVLLFVLLVMGRPLEARAAGSATPPEVKLAQTLSEVTGIAISPLLGVGAVGALRYYKMSPELRSNLPWHARPWFWVPALSLVFLCFLKDALGPVIPTALKKPLDFAELFENKFSALIATGVIVPLILEVFRALEPEYWGLSAAGLGVVSGEVLLAMLIVPLFLLAFGAVFLVFHTFNILIALSPFTTVDTVLKAIRTGVLATVAGTAIFSPILGGIWALLIVLLCFVLAGWAFRMAVFGEVFAWDLLTLRRRRFVPGLLDPTGFLACRMEDVPRRTYGKVHRRPDGERVFRYRPWLMGVPREVGLPGEGLILGRGLIHPSLMQAGNGKCAPIIDFPPRHAGHEKALGDYLGVREIRPGGVLAGWEWVKGVFKSTPPPIPTSPT